MHYKKIIAQIVGAGAIIALSAGSAYASLLNGSFEDAPFVGAEEGGAGAAWTPFGGVFRIQGSPPIGPAGAQDGAVVLKAFGGGSGAFQDVPANPGDTVDAGAWVLNDSADAMGGGQVAAVNIEWIDSGGGQISFISNGSFACISGDCSAAPVDTWTLAPVSGVAPAGTVAARIVVITGDFQPGGAVGAPRFDNAFAVVTPVPVPAAVWLFGSGLLGLVGVARRRKA